VITICLIIITLVLLSAAGYGVHIWGRNQAIRQWARATEHLDETDTSP
jgi:hypothetical protein